MEIAQLQEIGRMVHQYGMGATRTTIRLHHARVLLLDASNSKRGQNGPH